MKKIFSLMTILFITANLSAGTITLENGTLVNGSFEQIFLPSGVSDLKVWIDLSSSDYVNVVGGDVETAYDRSINGINLVGPFGKRPDYLIAAQNGLNVQSHPTLRYLTIESNVAGILNGTDAEMSVFIVFKVDSTPITGRLFQLGTTTNSNPDIKCFKIYMGSNGIYNIFCLDDSGTTPYTSAVSGGTIDFTDYHVMVVRKGNTVTNNFDFWVDGVQIDSSTVRTTTFTNMDKGAIGAQRWYDSSGGEFRGKVGECAVYTKYLSDQEVIELSNYAIDKWGL